MQSSKITYKGSYSNNIDDLRGIANAGGYWINSATATGTHPFGASTYYYLFLFSHNNAVTQIAIRYLNGIIKARSYVNNTWQEWTPDSVDLTGAVSSIVTSNLTTSRALISDDSGKVAVSTVTSTELGYLDGVTSAIQNQINAINKKTPLFINVSNTTGTSYISLSNIPPNAILLIEVQVSDNTYYGLTFTAWNIASGTMIYNQCGEYDTNKFSATIQVKNKTVALLKASLNSTSVVSSTFIRVKYAVWQ